MLKPIIAGSLLLASANLVSAQIAVTPVPAPSQSAVESKFKIPAPMPPASPEAVQSARETARAELERRLEVRFVVSGNEVYDRKTDRTWQRCNYGQTWDESNSWCKGIAKQLTVQAAIDDVAKNASGWRLPDLGELLSMLEAGCATYRSKDGPPLIFVEVKANTFYLTTSPHGNADNNMTGECFGSTTTSAGLSRKYVSIVRVVREGR